MPPKRKAPQNFDEHLGLVVENAARRFGGRDYLTSKLNWSSKTVDRRVRGEASFLVPELRLIAVALEETPSALVDAALKNYGDGSIERGWERLAAEYAPASAPTPNVDELATKREKKEERFFGEDWDEGGEQRAANVDPEHESDEPSST